MSAKLDENQDFYPDKLIIMQSIGCILSPGSHFRNSISVSHQEAAEARWTGTA